MVSRAKSRTASLLDARPARLKAFTLTIENGGDDSKQAREFLSKTGLEFLGEEIPLAAAAIDPLHATRIIEDYKPLDVECAAAVLSLLTAIRTRYPEWNWLVDGDGGDENLKDYPVEENPELTIRSVVSNRLLYQEGWGVDAMKHSLTYSGGLSRSCVRGYAPSQHHGFKVVSPFISPRVVAVAESIPFALLSENSLDRLYALKGEIVRRGIQQVLGRELPVFAKQRFQQGAMTNEIFEQVFAGRVDRYRQHFLEQYSQS